MKILFNWLMFGRAADDSEFYRGGSSEDDALQNLIDAAQKHGGLVFYTGVNDEDYVDGECIYN